MAASGEVMAKRYHMMEELGSGSFGVVYKAMDTTTGQLVAVKQVDLETSEDDIPEIQLEISVQSDCRSPHIVNYQTSFVRGHKLWIVMEYMGGGSCQDLLKPGPISEQGIAIVCREILLGLEYLHSANKIHRDIKAANVLLNNKGAVKLADFGVAGQLSTICSHRNTFVGTPFWMAPEVIEQNGYDCVADIWSLGITALELAFGEPPYSREHPMKVLFKIPKIDAPRLEGSQWSRDFKDFIACCLVKQPEHRATAKELLRHRFIRHAGKVEALQELIQRKRDWEANYENEDAHPKLYMETMNTMSPVEEADEWLFDTVKPSAVKSLVRSQKKRKSSGNILVQPLDESMAELELTDVHDFGTAHRVHERPQSMIEMPSTTRRVSGRKQPLVPDMSFGNSGSTQRLFRRVSDASLRMISPDGSIAERDENRPAIELNSKEAQTGRKIFSSVMDPVFQELHAQTGSNSKRHAISKVADAWNALDKIDPEGQYHLLKMIIEKVQNDPKLSTLLSAAQPATSPQKPKFVLAANNPHLKSHKRRQSLQTVDQMEQHQFHAQPTDDLLEGMPGKIVPGMEHTAQLGDILYSRWLDGVQTRWPAAGGGIISQR